MSVTPREFRRVMGAFATGVTVVTTEDGQGRVYGVTVNAFTSLSLEPMLVLVCLDNRLSGLEAFLAGGKFGVNVLAEDQQEVSDHFASPGSDRSHGIERVEGSEVPRLRRSLAVLGCRLVQTHEAGDHTILIGEVLEARRSKGEPLIFYQGRYRRLAK